MDCSIRRAKTTLYIEQYTPFDYSGCSATAIGPQAILTASHCELPTDVLHISTQEAPATIVKIVRDDRDHSIYFLKNAHFEEFADVNLNDPLSMGTDIHIIGSPREWEHIYRRGYIAGTFVDTEFPKELGIKSLTKTLYSIAIDHGDSGAGVFDAAGNVIAVISALQFDDTPSDAHVTMAASLPFAFDPEALVVARAFSIPDDPKE